MQLQADPQNARVSKRPSSTPLKWQQYSKDLRARMESAPRGMELLYLANEKPKTHMKESSLEEYMVAMGKKAYIPRRNGATASVPAKDNSLDEFMKRRINGVRAAGKSLEYLISKASMRYPTSDGDFLGKKSAVAAGGNFDEYFPHLRVAGAPLFTPPVKAAAAVHMA